MESAEFNALKDRLVPEDGTTLIRAEVAGDELASMTAEQAKELITMFGATTLMKLPAKEVEFFDWLRTEDEPVWNDLWEEIEEEDLYYVSMSHLGLFLPGKRGFPICDLAEQPNYSFTGEEINEEYGKTFVEHALDVVAEKGDLSMDQAFVIEVWRAPIDMWRFSWMYNLPIAEVKKMVHWLLEETILNAPAQREENPAPIESAPVENRLLSGGLSDEELE